MSKNTIVTIIHDNSTHDKSFIDLVKRYHDIKYVNITSLSADDFSQSLLIIIQINLADRSGLTRLREKMLLSERGHVPVLFLLKDFSRHEVVQANTLGASDYIAYPCPDDYFINILASLINRTMEEAWTKLSQAQESALKVSLKVLEDTFQNAANGEELSHEDLKTSCELILEATAKDGLTDWMNAIRQHHNYTYRHSMMVCGYLISFGIHFGVKNSDLQMLSLGGMLHDIGKAITPLAILNKPAKLNGSEWVIMKQHPENSRKILMEADWDQDTVDIAVHHHEKLDGTGYPDRLKGGEISDLARMTAIADVFSALTDKRSYKPAMSAENSINIMLNMEGYLDVPLVKAFRTVVLPEIDNNPVQKAG